MKRKTTAGGKPRAPGRDAEIEPSAGHRTKRLRLRAAWMYHVERRTQNEIADILQVGRVTVVRLLAEAFARNEVKITIEGDLADVVMIERKLEQRFGLAEAIVAPISDPSSDRTRVVSAAAGAFIGDFVTSGMRLGVGWGRTLIDSLHHMPSRPLAEFTVISMLGSISEARRFNPSEYAWQLSQAFGGECYLLAAPALVDSPQTRDTLIEKCGLDRIFQMATQLDAAIFSVGGVDPSTTIFQSGYMTESDRQSLIGHGAVGDLLYHFYDRSGHLIEHPMNQRVMSIPIETIQAIPQRILASGGEEKPLAILGAIKLARPTMFITDQLTAIELLDLPAD
jgi:DNA-binding transcriptional regulator LsrR (DeoR family)